MRLKLTPAAKEYLSSSNGQELLDKLDANDTIDGLEVKAWFVEYAHAPPLSLASFCALCEVEFPVKYARTVNVNNDINLRAKARFEELEYKGMVGALEAPKLEAEQHGTLQSSFSQGALSMNFVLTMATCSVAGYFCGRIFGGLWQWIFVAIGLTVGLLLEAVLFLFYVGRQEDGDPNDPRALRRAEVRERIRLA
jgi:hypothetical protein